MGASFRLLGGVLGVAAAAGAVALTITAAQGQEAVDSELPAITVDAAQPKAKKKAARKPTQQPASAPAAAAEGRPQPDDAAAAPSDVNSGEAAVARAQATAASATVVSRTRIEDAGMVSIMDAARQAPNVQFSTIGAPRFSFNTVRGIGNTIADNYFNSPIGVYVDGVQVSNAEFNRSLGDAQSVEILRGPQGTLFGHNSLGGVINITSRVPTSEPHAEVFGTIGNNGQRAGSVALSGPVIGEAVTGRAFFEYVTRDGFTDYARFDSTIDDLESVIGSGSLRFAPTRQFTATISGSIEHVDQGGYAYMPYDDFKRRVADLTPPNGDIRDSRAVSANVAYDFGSVQLRSITAWRDYDVSSNQDLAYNAVVAMFGGGRAITEESGDQVSQELRLTGNAGHLFSWVAGALYLNEDHTFDYLFGGAAFGGFYPSLTDYARREIAGYGEGTLRVWRGLELTAGVRVSEERHELVASSGFQDDESFTIVTPKFAAAYRFDQDRLVYASATRGARSGGFDRIASVPGPYDTEYLWNYEVGFKSEWLNRTLTFNAAAFYIDWTDQQIKEMFLPGVTRTVNAGESHSKGFELEASWRPATGLDLSGFLGVTHGEYDEFTYFVTGANLAGNKLVNTPEMTAGLSAQYKWPISGTSLFGVVRADYLYTGDQYFDPENLLKQSGYSIVNARLGVETEKFSAMLFAKNLFDEDYRTFGYHDFAGSPFQTDAAVAGESRLIGVTVGLKY